MSFPIIQFLHATLLFFSFVLTPGPNNLICVFLGKEYGYKKTFPFIFGACAARLIATTALVTIGEQLLFRFPWEQPLITVLGSLYMLRLASKTIKSGIKAKKHIVTETKPLTIWHGMILQWINVKAIVVQTTLIAAYRQPTYSGNLVFFIILNSFLMISLSMWTLLGKYVNPFLNRNPLANFLFSLVLGSLLAWLSLRFLYSGGKDLFSFFIS